MSEVAFSMPEPIEERVASLVSTGRYGNAEEYFLDLARRDLEKRESAVKELRQIIDQAEAGGISERTVDEVFEDARQKARQKGLLRD